MNGYVLDAGPILDEISEVPLSGTGQSAFAGTVTHLIHLIRKDGNDRQLEIELFGAVLEQLIQKARTILARFPSLARDVEPEALVNEVFSRLRQQLITRDMTDRKHFFAIACQNFRWILLDMKNASVGAPQIGGGISDLTASNTGVSSQVARAELFERVLEAIGKLPEACQQVLQFRIFLDLDERQLENRGTPFREIAEELGLAVGTVHARYHQCLRKLNRMVSEN